MRAGIEASLARLGVRFDVWTSAVAVTPPLGHAALSLLLGPLPIAGDDGTKLVPALLLSGFFNLVAVVILVRYRDRVPVYHSGVPGATPAPCACAAT